MGSGKRSQNTGTRRKKDYGRVVATRNDAPRILIVTEGEETEPNYLKGLIAAKQLSHANVVVDGRCGSDPMSVFRHARDRYKAEKKQGEIFDRVYCVFDKDAGHANYFDAIDAINKAAPEGVYHAISSVPCFEYWVLLHFTDSTKPYQAPGGQSSCELVVKDIKKKNSKYEKGMPKLYQLLEGKTEVAIKNAKKSLIDAEASDTDNPTTRMHLLVEYLYTLKK